MFTKDRVLSEARRIHDGTLPTDESPVYREWCQMAMDWLMSDPHEYARAGLQGFHQRSPEQIACDFHLNDKLSPSLTEAEYEAYMASLV